MHANAGQSLSGPADTVAGDIAVKHDAGLRLKIPCPPDHHAFMANDQAKMGVLVILNGNIQVLTGNGLCLVSGKWAGRKGHKRLGILGELLSVVRRVLVAEKFQHVLGHHP